MKRAFEEVQENLELIRKYQIDIKELNRKMNSLSADIIKNLPTEVHEAVEMGIVKFAIPCPAGLRRAVEEGMYSH